MNQKRINELKVLTEQRLKELCKTTEEINERLTEVNEILKASANVLSSLAQINNELQDELIDQEVGR